MLQPPLIAKLYAGQGKIVNYMDSIPLLQSTEVHQLENLRLVILLVYEILPLNGRVYYFIQSGRNISCT